MKKLLLTATVLTLLGAPLSAREVFAQSAIDWSGMYAGLYAGAIFDNGRENNYYDVSGRGNPANPWGSNITGTNFAGGGFIGANQQFSNGFVAGVQLDVGTGGSANGIYSDNFGSDPSQTFTVSGRLAGSGDVRLGYAAGNFMPYLTGGVSYMNFDVDAFHKYNNGASGPAHFTGSNQALGWNIGAGLNYAVSSNIILGAEYRYAQYSGATASVANAAVGTDSYVFQLNESLVRASLALKF